MCIPEVGSFRLQKKTCMHACVHCLQLLFLAKQGVAGGADWRATTLVERAGLQLLLKECIHGAKSKKDQRLEA